MDDDNRPLISSSSLKKKRHTAYIPKGFKFMKKNNAGVTLIQMLFLILALVLLGLKIMGINSYHEFATYFKPDELNTKKIEKKNIEITKAEERGEKVLDKFREIEKRKTQAIDFFKKFSELYMDRNFSSVYDLLSGSEKKQKDKDTFIEELELKEVTWLDPVIKVKFFEVMKEKQSMEFKGINFVENKAYLKILERYVDAKSSIPNEKDIENFEKLTPEEIESSLGELLVSRIQSGEVPQQERLIELVIIYENNDWKLVFGESFKTIQDN